MGLTVQFYVEVTTWHLLVYTTANSGIFVLFETEQYISYSFDKNSMCEKEKGSQITIEHQSILAIHKGRLITLPNSDIPASSWPKSYVFQGYLTVLHKTLQCTVKGHMSSF